MPILITGFIWNNPINKVSFLFNISIWNCLYNYQTWKLIYQVWESRRPLFFWRVHKIVEHQPGERLLHQLAERRVEKDGIKAVQVDVLAGLQLRRLVTVQLVALVQRGEVALNRQLSVDGRVLWGHFRFVEVVDVLDVSRAKAALEHERRVRSDQHGHGAGAAGGSGVAGSVNGDVGADCDGVTTILKSY